MSERKTKILSTDLKRQGVEINPDGNCEVFQISKQKPREKNYMYQRMVGGCQWVSVGWFVSPTALVEAASRTPSRSTQVDPSAMEDSHRSPPPVCPAEICSVDLRREEALRFLQTHDSLFVSGFKPFRKSTNSSAPQEQSQGFPSSLILVDLRDLKT